MRAPWRPRPISDEKLMSTNWGRRGLWWGIWGTAWCLFWLTYDAMNLHGWARAATVTFFGLLLIWNAWHIPSHWRSARSFDERHAAFVAQRERMATLMADHGVPEEVAQRIDQLALAGREDLALALIKEHVRPCGRDH